jgi:hypothetical protein
VPTTTTIVNVFKELAKAIFSSKKCCWLKTIFSVTGKYLDKFLNPGYDFLLQCEISVLAFHQLRMIAYNCVQLRTHPITTHLKLQHFSIFNGLKLTIEPMI